MIGGGARGSVAVDAVCYKPEDCGFETRRGELIFFQFASSSNSNEYQKQKNASWGRARPVHRADNFTAICEPII
jgi:hypothetical protein